MFKCNKTRRPCSVCDVIVDFGNAQEVRNHNKECNPSVRCKVLLQKVEEENKRLRRLRGSSRFGSSQSYDARYDGMAVANTSFGQGAYTSTMTQGISSDTIADIQGTFQKFSEDVDSSIVENTNGCYETTESSTSFKSSSNYENRIGSTVTQKEGGGGHSSTVGTTDGYNNESTESSTSFQSSSSYRSRNRSTRSQAPQSHGERVINDMNYIDTGIETQGIHEQRVIGNETIAENGIPITQNSLEMLHSRSNYNKVAITHIEKGYLELLRILQGVNAPHHVFNDILKWARGLDKKALDHPMSREKLVSTLAQKFSLGSIFPKIYRIILPSGNTVNVTKYCFLSGLFSLLTDDTLMQPSNLVFGDDIYREFDSNEDNHCYEDVETGSWYNETQFSVGNGLLVPIILYIDKTYVKSKPSEPISFSLGIFKRKVRNDPTAWRQLGLIPGKLSDLVPNKTKYIQSKLAEIRLNDWHAVCNFLLSDLKAAQQQNGLNWQINGKLVKLHIPIMFIIGDIEGHDKICTRKSGHTKIMRGVTHSCNIRRHECGDPYATCRYFKRNDISSLQSIVQDLTKSKEEQNEAISKLNSLGFYSDVKNAFAPLDYGANRNGVHGACAICLMHTFKQKFPNVVTELYFQVFSSTKTSKNRLLINRSVTRLIPWVLRQSYRFHPQLHSFTESLIKPKYTLSANEKFARVFALFLYCMTSYGWNNAFNSKNTQIEDCDEITKRVSLLEDTISIYYFLTTKSFSKSNIQRGREEVKSYLKKFKECIEYLEFAPDTVSDDDSTTSCSSGSYNSKKSIADDESIPDSDDDEKIDFCTFPKFHYLLHVIDMIIKFGSSLNFDGAMNESHHKYLTKTTGMRTQGRTDVFDLQTANNLASKIVLEKAFRRMDSSTTLNSKNQSQFQNNLYMHEYSSKFSVEANGQIKWAKKQYKLLPKVSAFFKAHVINKLNAGDQLLGFTDLIWKGNLIRAHPSYRNKEWYDWVIIQWAMVVNKRNNRLDSVYNCPAKVLLFFNLNGESKAIIHSTKVDEKTGLPSKAANTLWKKRGSSSVLQYWEMESGFRIVSIKVINATAFVYPDFSDVEMTEETRFKIEIKARDVFENKHEEN